MARKIHLAANKGVNAPVRALCASRVYAPGVTVRNKRSSYQFMASDIVRFHEFRNVPEDMRCAHCAQSGLQRYNQRRVAKGLKPVASLSDKGE